MCITHCEWLVAALFGRHGSGSRRTPDARTRLRFGAYDKPKSFLLRANSPMPALRDASNRMAEKNQQRGTFLR